MQRPAATAGLRHVALYVNQFAACEQFYVDLVGMRVEWRPDADNVYLSGGVDNLALHRSDSHFDGPQHLDHIGFILDVPEHVDAWHAYLAANGVSMHTAVKQHRDGARSFYCYDPDGNKLQFIFHPPLARGTPGAQTNL